jgi:ADP-heptose:LPS heptosyltransferase
MTSPGSSDTAASARPLPFRWYVMRFVDWLARRRKTPPRRRGVLVVIADCGLGDVTLAHFAISRFPEVLGAAAAEITLVGTQLAQSLAPLIFPGMQFRLIDETRFQRHALYRLRFATWLRRCGFATAICGSHMRKPMVCDALIELSDAPRQIVVRPYTTPKTQRMFDAYMRREIEIVEGGYYPTAEIERHARTLSAVARRPIPLKPPRVAWSAKRPSDLPPRYAVIAAGASSGDKCWPIDNYLAVADALSAHGLGIVFVGGSGDTALKNALDAAGRADRFIDRIGATSLPALFDLLAGAVLVVADDTGPAHIATALGRPTIVILGGGHFGANFPYPTAATPPGMHVLYRPMPCYHCHWICTQPRQAGRPVPCIDAVTVDQVLAAVDAALATSAGDSV